MAWAHNQTFWVRTEARQKRLPALCLSLLTDHALSAAFGIKLGYSLGWGT